ncbi:hypothetical protein Tco_0537516 [Tanacetum coccineum]
MIARKKPRKQSDDNSDDENRKCRRIVTFKDTLDSDINVRENLSLQIGQGFELILWGDFKIMMESLTEENDQSDFWSNHKIGRLSLGDCMKLVEFCILELEDGIVIICLVRKKISFFQRNYYKNLDLGLEVERESTVALDLIRFIKQQIDEE